MGRLEHDRFSIHALFFLYSFLTTGKLASGLDLFLALRRCKYPKFAIHSKLFSYLVLAPLTMIPLFPLLDLFEPCGLSAPTISTSKLFRLLTHKCIALPPLPVDS